MPQRGMYSEPKKRIDPEDVGLPPRLFLYTLDQLATLLSMDLRVLRREHVYFESWSTGVAGTHYIMARNIGTKEKPDWRVAEREFLRWLKTKGYKYYERGWLSH